MAAVILNGFAGTSTITGTGNYTGISDVTTPAAYSSFDDVADATLVICLVRDASQWEIGEYTKSGGSTPVLTRTTIRAQINGTASAVNWSAGEKFICTTIDGPNLMQKNTDNEMSARINMNGLKIGLDTDDDSYLYASADDDLSVYVNAAAFYRWFLAGGVPTSSLIQADSGAAAGPKISTYRNSASPAASDVLGVLDFEANNSSAAAFTYARFGGAIVDPTASSEDGRAYLDVAIAGTMRRVLDASITAVAINGSNLAPLVLNRTSNVGTGAGVIINPDGAVYTTAVANLALSLNRESSDGMIMDIRRDNVSIGSISNSSTTVAYNTFMGAHYSEWHPSVTATGQWEDLGTVVCTTDGVLPGFGERLPLVAPSTAAGDKRVYGVFQARMSMDKPPLKEATNEPVDTPASYLQIGGLGAGLIKVTGPVDGGDFLETSDVPGAARAQASPCKTVATVAKATQSSADDGTVRLIACTYEAG